MDKRLLVGLGAAGLTLAAALGLLLIPGPRSYLSFLSPHASSLPEDPRRNYAGPFQNVAPEVGYVSDQRCADCHPDQARSFALAPMGRSLLPVADSAVPPQDRSFHNPFEAAGSQFLVETRGGRMFHRRVRAGPDGRPVAELEWEVQYALGSGDHGYAYLTDRDGYLFETPISWYAEKVSGPFSPATTPPAKRVLTPFRGMWDLSPGFGQAVLTGRAVLADCLFCHANRATPVESSVNHYQQPVFDGYAIGCQRCHGPGELHVARRQRPEPFTDAIDYTIVNPRHLEPSLREAVCAQCHLQAQARVRRRGCGLYDYRPGLPLERFWSVFQGAAVGKENAEAVGHVEQMHESRCFQASTGPEQLGCISCHDPHEQVRAEQRVAYYRERCLQCHEQHGCSLAPAQRLSRQPADSCIDCHMPRYGSSDIPHAASTNHRILRTGASAGARKERLPGGDGLPIVSFYHPESGAEVERDRAVALIKLARSGDAAARAVLGRAMLSIEGVCQRDPEDLAAGEVRGYALALQQLWAEALAAFRTVLDRAPEQELVLVGAATAAEQLREPEAAEGYWHRAIAVNPWEPGYYRHLVVLLVKKKAWAEAQPECAVWLRLDPTSAEAATARVLCLLEAGNKQEARKEFARVEALRPANWRELQLRFEKKLQ